MIWVALSVVPLGAIAGLSMLLRSRKGITTRELADALLTSGVFSLCVFFLVHKSLGEENLDYAVGLSVLSGFGTNTLIGALVRSLEGVIKRIMGGSENDDK